MLPEGEAARVLDAVRQNFALSPHAEITIEANPGTLTQAKLAEYRAAGINRLSLGVQSFDDGVLRARRQDPYRKPGRRGGGHGPCGGV